MKSLLAVFLGSIIIFGFCQCSLAQQCTDQCDFGHIQKQKVVVRQKQQHVVYPQVYYSVGQSLELQAMIRYELRAILQEELQRALDDKRQDQPPPPPEEPKFSQQQGIISMACMRCHGGDEPKGDFSLAGELTDAKRSKVARAVLQDHMPPKKPLSLEAKSQLMFELFGE